ncbi:MAG: amidohydrolase family protein, partial [Acidimicrobiales bacterium]
SQVWKPSQGAQMDAQIAIRGGSVIDGTGAPARRADVGIADGRVVAIDDRVTAPREIDATGRIVTPGFVDIHTHYDPQVLWDPSLSPSCWHGVTSVVAGNCGYSIAPTHPAERASLLRTLDKVEDMRLATLEAGVEWDFETYGEYLDAVARRGTVINFGGYVGHTPVRLYVLGDDAYERKATDDEIRRMKQVVADSLNGGALGFSSDRGGFHIGDGGRPVPSIMASQEETEALMRVTGEINRGMVHIAPGENYEWVYEFQKSLGRKITWSSILTYPPEWKSRAPFKGKLDRHNEGRRDGADVWVQVTCRPIVQQILMNEPTPFYQMPAFADLVATPMADRPALYRDPAWRNRVYEEFESSNWINPGWETFTVADSQAHPDLEGRSLASIARDRGCTPFDVLADVALDDNLMARFEVTFANNDEAGITMLVQNEGCIMGLSDAGAHISQICDAVMPTDFLSSWVRDRQVMSLERGVRKLTGEIADVIGVDRGYVRVGSPADLVVIDLENLSTGPLRRVRDMPADGERLIADAPTGIDAVLVNGVPIRLDGKPLDNLLEELPGAVLRSAAGAARS